jgi:SAM-dependent methyltransferase
VPWLVDLARQSGGAVLEVACGTGRVTVPLAVQTRLPVVGLDADPAMLAAAQARGVRRLVQADMRRFAFPSCFALVAIPYNSLQLLDVAGRADCLRAAGGALTGGGMLAVECTDFQANVVSQSVDEEELASHDGVVLYGAVEHDLAARRTEYHRRFVVGGETFRDRTAIWSLHEDELLSELVGAGFVADSVERDGATVRCVATLRP